MTMTEEEEAKAKTKSIRHTKSKRAPRISTPFGDEQFNLEDDDSIDEASWLEVCQSCFVHSAEEWVTIFVGIIMILCCFYFFGLGLDFMSNGAKVMTGCVAGELFAGAINPMAGVMIGVLTTVLLQSSSSTTSIVVGLVGADDSLITVQQGIYMIMGANIGTTITNTIVALGHFQNRDQLELAFAGATVHDLFNFFTVAILLPLEVATGYLYHLTAALVRGADTEAGESWEGPAKRFISPLAHRVILANKAVTNAVAAGGSCEDFYPIICTDPENPTKSTCQVGLIACDKATGLCPAFFDPYASRAEDQASGMLVFCIGLILIFISLFLLVHVLTRLLLGVSVRVIYKATNINGYLLIAIGAGITIILQSSSTTTSFVTPVVGMGALRLEQMYPITIGANLGTTVSALLAALVTDGNEALQVALAHLMFNVTGFMIWYPIPALRYVPVECARRLGRYAHVLRSFTIFYIIGMFFLLPSMFLGLCFLFTAGEEPLTITGGVLTGVLGLLVVWWIRWCYYLGGRAKFYNFLERTRDTHEAKLTLPSDMDRAKRQIRQHQEYAGLRIVGQVDTEDDNNSCQSKADAIVVRKAVRKLANKMKFVKMGISMLYFHTGLPEDGLLADMEAEGGSDDSDSEEEEQHATSQRISSTSGRSDEEIRLWNVVPLSFKLAFALVFSILIWALVELFSHDSKASTGAAAFLTILVGFTVLYGAFVWLFSPPGRTSVIEYFHNHRMRNKYIKSLPYDMILVQSELKELLSHYRLKIDEAAFKDKSSTSEASSTGTPRSEG